MLVTGSESTFAKSPELMNGLFILPGQDTDKKLSFTADQGPPSLLK